jgi:hypothetical protein
MRGAEFALPLNNQIRRVSAPPREQDRAYPCSEIEIRLMEFHRGQTVFFTLHIAPIKDFASSPLGTDLHQTLP